MNTLRRFVVRLLASATRRRDDTRLREEVEEHLDLLTADYIHAGFAPAEARRRAILKFGAIEAIKEHYRDQQGLPFVEHLMQDVRYTLRQLRKAPLFTVTATLSLAVGIGANAAIFTLVDRLLVQPLPVAHAQELVFVTDERSTQQASPRFSYPFYAALKDNDVLNGLAAHYALPLNAAINGRVARVTGELVSGNYFAVLGAGVQLGRPLTAEDDRTPSSHAVAVISDRFWRRTLDADASVLGRTVRLNNCTFTVIGVAARGFTGTEVGRSTDVWLPMMMQKEVGRNLLTEARTNWVEMIGRLKPGVSQERAGAELTAYLESPAAGVPARFLGRRLILLPANKGNSSARRDLAPALQALVALTVLALLLACVTVASLLVVRSVRERRRSPSGWRSVRDPHRSFDRFSPRLSSLRRSAALLDCWQHRGRLGCSSHRGQAWSKSTRASTCACSCLVSPRGC